MLKRFIRWLVLPLFLHVTSSLANQQPNFAELESTMQGHLGVYAVDTSNDHTIAYHADQRFPFDSTFKVILVAAILKESETHPGLLQQTLYYTPLEVDESGYAPIASQHIATGMTIQQLCIAALNYSDNTAANLLIKQLGGLNAVNAFAQSMGDKSFRLDRWEPDLNDNTPGDLRDTTTPEAMGKTLQKLVLGNVLSNAQRTLLQTWLKQNMTGKERIGAGIPKNWIMGDKTGMGKHSNNDIAVIWPPHSSPIVLVIYSTAPQSPPPNTLIASVTHFVISDMRSA